MIMKRLIVYCIRNIDFFGCLPECYAVEVDDYGKLSIENVKINSQNKDRHSEIIDEQDEILLDCCFKLEPEAIIKNINNKKIKTWDKFIDTYFNGHIKTVKDRGIKDYVVDYVCNIQNKFFNNISNKRLYVQKGKFPFMWQLININIQMPELFYCFDYQQDKMLYSLDISLGKEQLKLKNADLISRKTSRILIENTIYEFEDYVDGAKITPFFNKDFVIIPESKVEEYVNKIILPLVPTEKVIAKGFEINIISEISKVILKVKETSVKQQLDLFSNTDNIETNLVFNLLFEYEKSRFYYNRIGREIVLDFNDKFFTINHIVRDKAQETNYANRIKSIGLDFEKKSPQMSSVKGIDWLNENISQIEAVGIEVEFDKQKSSAQPIFLGERKLTLELNEQNDWFDIKGKVKFGDYNIPFLQILNYIKQNKNQILLPSGELAQIPQAWFDEYKTLIHFVRLEGENAVISKQHCVLAKELRSENIVNFTAKNSVKKLFQSDDNLDYEMPKGFAGKLREYQKIGYYKLRLFDEIGLGVCLADEMGLGKTIQALCLLQWLKESNRKTHLLVVPTSLIINWQREAGKFCPELNIYVHHGSGRSDNLNNYNNYDAILTSYAILRRDKHIFYKMLFDTLLLDESQAIKNPASDISKTCLQITAKHFITLTGTPLENSISDLWSQVHFFNRNMLGKLNSFTKAVKEQDKLELYTRLLKPFIIRRTKSEVLKELPEKSISIQWCDMSMQQEVFYKEIRNQYISKFLENSDEDNKLNPIMILEGLLRLRQAANHPKIIDKSYFGNSGKFEVVCNLTDDIINQGSKVLIFSSFVEHLKLFRKYFDQANIGYCYLDGSTKNRQEQVDSFQNNDDYSVFLLSLKAGGTGLNLTAADYVFLLDPWWNPAAESQAFDRAHRIGQKNKVFVYKFISKGTIEEKIIKLQEEKLKLFDSIIRTDSEILKGLNTKELLNLIE